MIGVLVATELEGGPLLHLLAARKIADAPFAVYEFSAQDGRPGGRLVISGMGGRQAALAVEHLIAEHGATTVINVGICGALSPGLSPGQVLRVSEALDGQTMLRGARADRCLAHSPSWHELPAGRLASVDEPVFDAARRLTLARQADLVDMEGFATAQACRRRGVRCCLIKGVSDLADHAGKQDLHRNLQQVSAALAQTVAAGLADLRDDDGPVRKLLNFAKAEHTLFSLPLLLAGAWLGAGGRMPAVSALALIALAGLGARTLGMSMNRIFDRRLDALNRRTAGRELPSGRMRLATAYGVASAGLAIYLLACAGLGGPCLRLSAIPAVPLIGYSLLKRFTSLCHFGIGLCLALGPLGAFVAASSSTHFTAPVLLLAAFTFFWMSGFDMIYALQDLASDRRTGVRSVPAALGSRGAQAVAAAVHLAAVAAIVALWRLGGAGLASGAALAVCIGAMLAAYVPAVPLAARFFPLSAVAGIAGSLVGLLGGLP